MVDTSFVVAAIFLILFMFIALYRAFLGPTCCDRVVAINAVSAKVISVIVLVSYIFGEEYFLDVALAYALISFITVVGIAKYLEKGTC